MRYLNTILFAFFKKNPAWYDNEMGYTHSLVEHVILLTEGMR